MAGKGMTMNTYTAHDNGFDRVAFIHDQSRPFVVLCTGATGSKRIVGRYRTMASARRKARQLAS
jgi:hypothetical protein